MRDGHRGAGFLTALHLLAWGSTAERDQTFIRGIGIEPSPKIEFGQTHRPRNRGLVSGIAPGVREEASWDSSQWLSPPQARTGECFSAVLHLRDFPNFEVFSGFVDGQEVSDQLASHRDSGFIALLTARDFSFVDRSELSVPTWREFSGLDKNRL